MGMVGGDDDQRVGMMTREVEPDLDRAIEGDGLANLLTGCST